MKTIGELLKKARLEKQLTFKEVELQTKIRQSYLQAIEEDNFAQLPIYTTARGLLKNYAEFLGLSVKPILAVFRRDFARASKKGVLPLAARLPLGKRIDWSPKRNLMLAVGLFFLALMSYLCYQYFSLVKAPSLKIIAPKEKEEVESEEVEIIGQASRDASVTVNDLPLFLSSQGEFRYSLELFPGENKIAIEAKSKQGKKTRVEMTIFRLDK